MDDPIQDALDRILAEAPQCDEAEAERAQAIEDTFTPWHKDPIRIARLYRWLEQREKVPIDVPAFIETAISWQKDYDDLCMWNGKS